MTPLRRGDFVRVTADGRTVRAMVTLASTNGRSIMVMFDARLGGWLGAMPLSLNDDGTWSALDGMPATIQLTESLVAAARRDVAQGAGHDCDEWRDTPDHRCALCDRPAEARS